MFAEILFLIFGLSYLACKDLKYRQRVKEYNANKCYAKSNQDLENSLLMTYLYDYQYVSKDKVPEKYRDFFKFNYKAMFEYFRMLAARDVWKQGYRPYLMSVMPNAWFDFLAGFRKKYDQQVDEFNKHYDEVCNKTAVCC